MPEIAPASTDDIFRWSAAQIANCVRQKKVSVVEVVDSQLDRIEAINPKLNAVVQLASDRARSEAREADAALANGDIIGPLHGVPITVKDSLDTAGIITTAGTLGRADYVPARDATAVARLRNAGAIVLGKTNTPEMTISFDTDNLVYGRTNNPYDLSRTPGGSSGGAASIVAAEGSPLDLGSDTGGSIRVPAHFCGIAGIKPTSGRVPRTGHIIPSCMGALDAFTQIGPMARYVQDLALALPIIVGVDWRDPAIVPMPLYDPAQVDVRGLRIAFHSDNGLMAPTADVDTTIRNAAGILRDAGASVEEARPGILQESPGLQLWADGWAWLSRLLEMAGTTKATTRFSDVFGGDAPLTAGEYTAMLEERDAFRSNMLSFLRNYDAILCPVRPYPAPAYEELNNMDLVDSYSYTSAYNVTGWPAAAVRAGTSTEGLPIGVQIVSRPWREDVTLALAKCIETGLGGWQRPHL